MEELVPDSIVAGKLRVIRRLGAGGVGEVYEVEHGLTKHRRALKVLHPRLASRPDVVERFFREASAAGRIGDAHICETFDAGHLDDAKPYLLMELLSGRSMGERLRSGPMDLQEAAFIVRQACLGVAAAHDAGIVHRDLKPDNLFIADVDGKPFVKVLDFGVSRFGELAPGEAKLTAEGHTLGTPRYMSPEQIAGRTDLDKRADVYALGVILYEAVSGKPPFEAASLAALAVQIHRGQPPALGLLCPGLPAEFLAVVERAMHPDKTQRFDDARQLHAALAPFEEAGLDQTAPQAPAQRTERLPPHVPKPPPSRFPALAIAAPAVLAAAALVFWLTRTPAPVAATPPPPQQAPALVPPPAPAPAPAAAAPVEVAPSPVVAKPPPAAKPPPPGPAKNKDLQRDPNDALAP